MTVESTVDTATVDEGAAADNAAPKNAVIGPRVAAGVVLAAGLVLLADAVQGVVEDGLALGGPRLTPLIVACGWVVLAVLYLIKQLIAPEGQTIAVRTPVMLIIVLVAYALVLKYSVVGYIIATAAFFFITARLLSVRPLREVVVRDVSVAVLLSVGIYLAFVHLLGIALPGGVLPL